MPLKALLMNRLLIYIANGIGLALLQIMTDTQLLKRNAQPTPRLIKAQKPLRPVSIAPTRRPVKVMSPVRILVSRPANG